MEPGGPADEAGLKQGDVVVQIDGRAVADANALRNQIAGIAARLDGGARRAPERPRRDPVGDASSSVSARSRKRRSRLETTARESGFGMAVSPITPRLAEELELPRTATGLVVTDVDPAGLGASAGVRAGDVIKSVNGQSVDAVPALRKALEARRERPALLLVSRNGADIFIALPRADS